MILGAEPCDHRWIWDTNTTLRCTRCDIVDSGHDRAPSGARCFECKKDH